ncbi:Uncharacterised protein [Mycobacteroides abscessus subsp. massiliense]|nr:Uncharacterised protein [Mycobacteroides abscessus subsp. massiliense]
MCHRLLQGGIDVIGSEVGGPRVGSIPLRVVGDHSRNGFAVLVRIDVAAVLRARILQRPAEQRTVERLRLLEVRRGEVDPRWGSERSFVTSGHGVSLSWKGAFTGIDPCRIENSSRTGLTTSARRAAAQFATVSA